MHGQASLKTDAHYNYTLNCRGCKHTVSGGCYNNIQEWPHHKQLHLRQGDYYIPHQMSYNYTERSSQHSISQSGKERDSHGKAAYAGTNKGCSFLLSSNFATVLKCNFCLMHHHLHSGSPSRQDSPANKHQTLILLSWMKNSTAQGPGCFPQLAHR